MDSLAQHAAIEEASSLDPEGVFGYMGHNDLSTIDDKAPTPEVSQGNREIPDARSNDDEIAALSPFNASSTVDGELTKAESIESDVAQLQALFPEVKSLDIRQALVDANGVVAAALDTLLSVQYLQSTQQPASANAPLDNHEFGPQPASKTGQRTGYDKQKNEASLGDPNRARSELSAHLLPMTCGTNVLQLRQPLPI